MKREEPSYIPILPPKHLYLYHTHAPSCSRDAGKNEYQDFGLIGINFNDLKLGNMHLCDHFFWTKNWYRFCTKGARVSMTGLGLTKTQPTDSGHGHLPSNPLLGVEDRVGKVVSMRIWCRCAPRQFDEAGRDQGGHDIPRSWRQWSRCGWC